MKKIYELKNNRKKLLDEAQAAVDANNTALYDEKMAQIRDLNAEIEKLEALETENERFSDPRIPGNTAKTTDDDYKNAFMYALTNGITVRRGRNDERCAPLYNALTETGGGVPGEDGGFLVPVDFDNMIHEVRRELVSLAQYFNVENVRTLSGWRAVDTVPTQGFAEVAENAEITAAEQPKFSKITYTLKKYAGFIAVSSELMEDNTAGLMTYLSRWFAKKSVNTENALLLGLLEGIAATALTAKKEMDELKKAIVKELDPAVSRNAKIITNQSGFARLVTLNDSTGRGLLQPDPKSADMYKLLNKPIIVVPDSIMANRTDDAAYAPIYIGDFKAYGTLFRRNRFEVASTEIGGNAWRYDAPEIRGIVRLDAKAMDNKAVIKREISLAE